MNEKSEGSIRPIKAITIYQPWATLKAKGIKRYETRSWKTSYRGPIAIHAGGEVFSRYIISVNALAIMNKVPGFEDLKELPRGAVIAVGNLIACHKMDKPFQDTLSDDERAMGNFGIGRYAWEFADLVECEPIPAKGKQGLWSWTPPAALRLESR